MYVCTTHWQDLVTSAIKNTLPGLFSRRRHCQHWLWPPHWARHDPVNGSHWSFALNKIWFFVCLLVVQNPFLNPNIPKHCSITSTYSKISWIIVITSYHILCSFISHSYPIHIPVWAEEHLQLRASGVATLPDSVIGRLSLQLSGSGQPLVHLGDVIQTWIWCDRYE